MIVLGGNRCLESLIMKLLLEKYFKLTCAELAPCGNICSVNL